MRINIFYDEVKFRVRNVKKIKSLIIKVIRNEKRIPGDLNFIFVSDEQIKEMNKEFLKRDNFTDVLAFEYNKTNVINGEVYISINRVKINAMEYKVSLRSEIIRVMVHGTLHLCGYNDKNIKEKNLMREMENKWIREFMII